MALKLGILTIAYKPSSCFLLITSYAKAYSLNFILEDLAIIFKLF